MAAVNSIGVYRGESVQLNFGVSPSTFTTQALLAGATVVPVVSTVGFPSSGTAYVLPQAPNSVVTTITYTGITAGALTGCANVPAAAAGALVTCGMTDITGWTIQFTLKRQQTDAATLLTKAATILSNPGGIFRIALAKADTNRKADTYQHDIWRIDVGSEGCLSVGPFTVLQEVLN